MKNLHMYNYGILLEWIMTVIRPMTSKKMQDRVSVFRVNNCCVFQEQMSIYLLHAAALFTKLIWTLAH